MEYGDINLVTESILRSIIYTALFFIFKTNCIFVCILLHYMVNLMIHYNKDNNAYCSAVNAQNVETREHNTV